MQLKSSRFIRENRNRHIAIYRAKNIDKPTNTAK